MEQSAEVTTAGDGNWIDVPGLAVTFPTSAATTTVDLTSVVTISGVGGPTRCDLRFVTDASPGGVETSVGVNQTFQAPVDSAQMIGIRRLSVGSGNHAIKVQVAKAAGIYANTSCRVSFGRLTVETR